jgi:hypothetical protein
MTSIFSFISGQFGKSFILGTLLPVALFTLLALVFVVPLFPYDWPVLEQLLALNPATIAAVTFAVLLFSGLLFGLNSTIKRYYEGYPWEMTHIGQLRKRHYQSQLEEARYFMGRTISLRNELRRRRNNVELLQKIETRRIIAGQKIISEFPISFDSVLPTRLGNILRSFENYPRRQYNIAGPTVWPRLRSAIDDKYTSAIDDAKTLLDFMMNGSILSILLALSILIVGLLYPVPLASRSMSVWWGIEIIVAAFASYAFYILAISQAKRWGDMFKGAFDLYRWNLLSQLGYKRMPTSVEEERALWGAISRQMIYGDPPQGRLPEYATLHTFAYGYLGREPYMVDLQVTRGVGPPEADESVRISLHVRNTDAQNRRIENVVVSDLLQDGFEYIWQSAEVPERNVDVLGANPYYFNVGTLNSGTGVILTYRAIRRGGKPGPASRPPGENGWLRALEALVGQAPGTPEQS